ncbi:MAG: ATP-binding protein [Bacteroidetes bacterium]|nr:ATP-binding protein [Bacteroidota bacterium]
MYRTFATVLGEAISNSWDANAHNVRIYIDRQLNSFFIKDDGDGMSKDDFQNKFLKIGYSKRKDENAVPPAGRSFIGRKGIGKLALLSCAEKISVISKTETSDYIGGVIDNSGLDDAIENDLTPDRYELGIWKMEMFERFTKDHNKGTIIYFESIKDTIKNSLTFLKKTIALYFRFSLLDSTFNIFVNDEKVAQSDLTDLGQKTEFLWNINGLDDPYIRDVLTKLKENKSLNVPNVNYKGFIASVEKPRDLKIMNIEERVGVDLFVNGRIRERDILRHIPSSRIVENYLYGQIHCDILDDDVDRFTSSREDIVADDPKFKEMLENLNSNVIRVVIEDWDTWRRKHRKPGDPDNLSISRKERRASELFNEVSEDFVIPENSANKQKVEAWVASLGNDAVHNFTSYAECFISENLMRKYIAEKSIALAPVQTEIDEMKRREARNKADGNINIDLRQSNLDSSYLDMASLAKVSDNPGVQNTLHNDAKQYRPIRDALMHTALLTQEAKEKLKTIRDNIKGRIRTLLS